MPELITYSEITGTNPTDDSLRKVITCFRSESTFFLLAALNMMLSLFEGKRQKYRQLQGFLVHNLIRDKLRPSVLRAASLDSEQFRPVFNRWHMLMLMKRVLLEAPEDGEVNPNQDREAEAKYKIGDACLMLGDFLVAPEQKKRLQNRGGEGERERILDELMTQWLPPFEFAHPPDEGLAVARSDEYANLFERDLARFRFTNGQSLEERFKELTGISLRRYLWLLLGAYALCLDLRNSTHDDLNENMARLNFDKALVFSKMNVTPYEASAFFERIVSDLTRLKESAKQDARSGRMLQYDFTTFRSHPLVHNSIKQQNYTCLDFSFLIEKMGAGVYHTVLGSLPTGDPDRDRFQIYWGEIFERYINDRLREVSPVKAQGGYASTFFDKPWSKKQEAEAFDGVLDYWDALVIMEYKGGYLSLDAKYSGVAGKLLADIAKKIGEDKGIKQLIRGIDRLFNKESDARDTFSELDEKRRQRVKQFGSEDALRVKRVYPVIVVQDLALGMGFVNRRLRQQFSSKIAGCNLRLDVRVRPLSLLTIEDLEVLIPHLGEITLPDILDEYGRDVHEPRSTFHAIFQRYLRRRGIKPRANEWSQRRFGEVIEAIKKQFVDIS